MKRLLASMALVSAACAQSAGSTTTPSGATTTSAQSVITTTSVPQRLEIRDCSTPPVTFSALCQIYELVQEWHVDRPIPSSVLADAALGALRDHTSTTSEGRPRTLFCAVPDPAFEEFCQELASMVGETGIAVGPAVEEAVLAMTEVALDPFTYYVPPDQIGSFRENGLVGGVGVLLDATNRVGSRCARVEATCPLEIVFVLEGNPGAEAGLMPGDEILSIDGVPVRGQRFTATAAAIAGDGTGTVILTVDRDGRIVEFEIERRELTIPTVDVSLPIPDVGYIRIPDFEQDVAGLVEEALGSLAKASPVTIVVDLRDNPGGFLDTVVQVASQFIDDGTVMTTRTAQQNFVHPADAGGLATEANLIVVVNNGTVSAAEILAGALRDQRGAVIVGASTFGKDAVQIPFDLRNGGQLYVSVARWATPSGLSVANGGLTPDRELDLPADMPVEQLVRAALAAAS